MLKEGDIVNIRDIPCIIMGIKETSRSWGNNKIYKIFYKDHFIYLRLDQLSGKNFLQISHSKFFYDKYCI